MRRRHALAAATALLALPLTGAAAAQTAPTLKVAPAGATPRTALTVTWTPARAVPAGVRVSASTLSDTGCTSRASARLAAAVPAGRPVRVRLAPRPRWCVRRLLRISATRAGKTLAATSVRVGTPVQVTVLSGTVTIAVPGRPDRAATLSGQVRGGIPGPHFRLDRDITSSVDISELRLGAPPADPACTAEGAFPRALPLAPGGSMTLRPSGVVTATVPLALGPAALTGCAAAPGAPATTSIRLSGTAAAATGGLRRLAVTGTLAGVALAGGASATITVAATVQVDLGGGRA